VASNEWSEEARKQGGRAVKLGEGGKGKFQNGKRCPPPPVFL
jgi:hypothetical protein